MPFSAAVFRHQPYQLRLINPFGIARSTRTHVDVVLCKIGEGWGESSPTAFYGEDAESVQRAFDTVAPLLERADDLDCIDDVMEHVETALPEKAQSARAAIDIALHDRLARRLGVPLFKLLGRAENPERPRMTSFTIGIDTPDEMMRKVDDARAYEILKIKLGKDLEADLAVMKLIRQAAPAKTIRVDANGGWTLEQARRALPVLADLGVEFVEQPLYKGSFEQLAQLKKSAPVPLFVDEDSMVAADLPRLQGVVDGINIKLMKSGGLAEARRMVAVARSLGFGIMLGCMIESNIAISAAAHLSPYVDFIDLDGNLLISNDPFTGTTCTPEGRLHLPTGAGLGCEPKPEFAATLSVP